MSPVLNHPVLVTILLGILAFCCWLGVLGMWRMKEPMQSLHYLSVPASAGVVALVGAVFLQEGNNQVSWKTLLIGVVLFAINSVGAHATARAFRLRELGHWEPSEGDPFEFVRDTRPQAEP